MDVLAWWMLGIVSLAHVMYIMCQYMLFYTKDEMQKDVEGLSDTAYGLLVGYSFSLVFVVVGVPVGHVSDRHSRKLVISCSVIVWSGAVVAQAMVTQVWQLALCRMVLGAGQAGFNAASLAMIADFFAASQRPLTNALFMLGVYMGGGLTSYVGGSLGDDAVWGWRWATAGVGIVSAGLGLVFILTVRERQEKHGSAAGQVIAPGKAVASSHRYGSADDLSGGGGHGDDGGHASSGEGGGVSLSSDDEEQLLVGTAVAAGEDQAGRGEAAADPTYWAIYLHMCELRSMVWLVLSSGVRIAGGLAFGSFVPSFFRLNYPRYRHEVTVGYGLVVFCAGSAAALMGGWITRKWIARSQGTALWVAAGGALVSCPFVWLMMLARDIMGGDEGNALALGLAACACAYLSAELWMGPVFSVIQRLLPVNMRGGGLALFFAGCAFLDGAGPVFAGILMDQYGGLSDAYDADDSSQSGALHNASSRKYIIAGVITAAYALAAAGFLWTLQFLEADQRRVIQGEAAGRPLVHWERLGGRARAMRVAGVAGLVLWVVLVVLVSLAVGRF